MELKISFWIKQEQSQLFKFLIKKAHDWHGHMEEIKL